MKICLLTFNARYSHSSFALRCLRANLGAYRADCTLLEYDLKANLRHCVKAVQEESPDVLGISVYIWNAAVVEAFLRLLQADGRAPLIVLGGPEVSWDPSTHRLFPFADYVICGEGEEVLHALCRQFERGERPSTTVIKADPVELSQVELAYDEYSDEDIAHRIIYVETARGCPFGCEYCLSARDRSVRYIGMERLLPAFERLLQRGVLRFKFLDRSFNAGQQHAVDVLTFFQQRMRPGLQLHLEMIPDRLADGLKALIAQFPPHTLHFEVGIQTYNEDVAALINRRCNFQVADDTIRYLIAQQQLAHADLIAGLPGESLDSFARGFDRLFATGVQELQLGILKRLRGAPIDRHTAAYCMSYCEDPPYEVCSTGAMPADDMERIQHFARYWEVLHNRGRYRHAMELLCGQSGQVFAAFMELSDYLFATFGRTHSIPMLDMLRVLQQFLTEHVVATPEVVRVALLNDYMDGGRRMSPPHFLAEADCQHL